MEAKPLIDYLKQVEDPRALRGRRYPLWLLLLMVILGTMSGCQGYVALEDFGVRHQAALCQRLGLPFQRFPSDSTFRRLFEQLDFKQLNDCFTRWVTEQLGIDPGEWMAVDGKSIAGTLQQTYSAQQNFVNLVSVYSQKHEVVVAAAAFENGVESEIGVVQRLLEQLHLSGVVFTFDALHAQKKTLKLLVEQGNDYVVGVKGNQPKLMQAIEQSAKNQPAISCDVQHERTRDREVERTVKVYDALAAGLPKGWEHAQSLVVMHRSGLRAGQPFERISYYLSSLKAAAWELAIGIRGHRLIENSLHWVKDVVFGEDEARFASHTPASNWSVVRNFALNLFRRGGHHSITRAIRMLGHDVDALFNLLTMN